MQDIYKVETHPLALSENMITGDKYRITFLTEGLIRLEYDEEGVFEEPPHADGVFQGFSKSGLSCSAYRGWNRGSYEKNPPYL